MHTVPLPAPAQGRRRTHSLPTLRHALQRRRTAVLSYTYTILLPVLLVGIRYVITYSSDDATAAPSMYRRCGSPRLSVSRAIVPESPTMPMSGRVNPSGGTQRVASTLAGPRPPLLMAWARDVRRAPLSRRDRSGDRGGYAHQHGGRVKRKADDAAGGAESKEPCVQTRRNHFDQRVESAPFGGKLALRSGSGVLSTPA